MKRSFQRKHDRVMKRKVENGIDAFKLMKVRLAVAAVLSIVLGLTTFQGSAHAEIIYKDDPHIYRAEVITPHTSTQEGLRKITCVVCGHSFTQVVPTSGHSWSEWRTNIAATCTSEGSLYRVCNTHLEAPHHEEKTTPRLSSKGVHSYSFQGGVSATCTTDGDETYVCSTCGDVNRVFTPPLGHVWGEWIVEYEATETEDGRQKHVCDRDASHAEYLTVHATGATVNPPRGTGGPSVSDPAPDEVPDEPAPSPEAPVDPEEVESVGEEDTEVGQEVGIPDEIMKEEKEDLPVPQGVEIPSFEYDFFTFRPNSFDLVVGAADLLMLLIFAPLALPITRQWIWVRRRRKIAKTLQD